MKAHVIITALFALFTLALQTDQASSELHANKTEPIIENVNELNNEFEYRIRIRGAFPSECDGEGDHYIASCMFEGDECDSNVQPTCFALPEESP